jgi:hypothetical protein
MDNPERHVTLEARHLTETNNTKYTTQKCSNSGVYDLPKRDEKIFSRRMYISK